MRMMRKKKKKAQNVSHLPFESISSTSAAFKATTCENRQCNIKKSPTNAASYDDVSTTRSSIILTKLLLTEDAPCECDLDHFAKRELWRSATPCQSRCGRRSTEAARSGRRRRAHHGRLRQRHRPLATSLTTAPTADPRGVFRRDSEEPRTVGRGRRSQP